MMDLAITRYGVPAFSMDNVISCSREQYILQMLYREYMTLSHSSVTGYQSLDKETIGEWLRSYLASAFSGNEHINSSRIKVEMIGDSTEMKSSITYTLESGETLTTGYMEFPFSVSGGALTSLDNPEPWLSVFTKPIEFDERVLVTVSTQTDLIEVACFPIVSIDHPAYLFVPGADETISTGTFSIDVEPGRRIYLVSDGIEKKDMLSTIIHAEITNTSVDADILYQAGEPCITVHGELTGPSCITGTYTSAKVSGIGDAYEIHDVIDQDPVFVSRPTRGKVFIRFRSKIKPGSYWLKYHAVRQGR